MSNPKVSKKRIKSDHLLEVVTKYKYVFLGILCHIFILFAFSVSAEFHDMIGSRYETFVELITIATVIVLVIVLAMGWTYPMSNEEPLVILLLWVLLSSRISTTHCFCCHSGVEVSTLSITDDAVPMEVEDMEEVAAAALVVGAEKHHKKKEKDFIMESWEFLVSDCRLETFNFIYSLLCVILVMASFFTELRNQYISLLFRASTVVLIAILVLLLVVSPSLCSKFSITHSFISILRITLFHTVWFLNHHRRETERLLALQYSEALTMTTETLRAQDKMVTRAPHRYTTPRALFLEITRLCKRLAAIYSPEPAPLPPPTPTRKKGVKKRLPITRKEAHTLLLPLKGGKHRDDSDEESNEEDEQEEEEEDAERVSQEKKKPKPRLGVMEETLTDIVCEMAAVSNSHKESYLSGTISWKNRSHSKHLLHIIDLAHTVWILIVCPHWLLLAPVELLWLLYSIRVSKNETLETLKLVKLLDLFLSSSDESFRVDVRQ